jgi:hypothetical protein
MANKHESANPESESEPIIPEAMSDGSEEIIMPRGKGFGMIEHEDIIAQAEAALRELSEFPEAVINDADKIIDMLITG